MKRIVYTVGKPWIFKRGGKLLINIWYYILYKHVLYKEINLKYMYQFKSSKINFKILLK
jgi:hypothetical protein